MITVDGVTRKYGNFTAVDDVSFTAQVLATQPIEAGPGCAGSLTRINNEEQP